MGALQSTNKHAVDKAEELQVPGACFVDVDEGRDRARDEQHEEAKPVEVARAESVNAHQTESMPATIDGESTFQTKQSESDARQASILLERSDPPRSLVAENEAPAREEMTTLAEEFESVRRPNACGPVVKAAAAFKDAVCLGLITLMAACDEALPDDLVWPSDILMDDGNSDDRWQKQNWTCKGLEFILCHGYRPIEVSKPYMDQSGAPILDLNIVMPPFDMTMEATRLILSTEPFAQIAPSHAKALYPLLAKGRISLLSRCQLLSSMTSETFAFAIESLVFCDRRHTSEVYHRLRRNGIYFKRPTPYTASEYADHPELLFIEEKKRKKAKQPFVKPVDTDVPQKHANEWESLQQVEAVYASLPDGESMLSTKANERYIRTKLLPHQEKALTFLLDREQERSFQQDRSESNAVSLWRPIRKDGPEITSYENVVTRQQQDAAPHICYSAILADEMGLGKTLVVLALIANTLVEAKEWSLTPVLSMSSITNGDRITADDESVRTNDQEHAKRARTSLLSSGMTERMAKERTTELKTRSRATLVILPLTLILVWAGQLKEHWVAEDQPKVYIHHGPSRSNKADDIAKHHIVLTTYDTLASEFSDMIAAEEGSSDEEEESHAVLVDEAKTRRMLEAKERKRKRRANARKRIAKVGAGPLQQIEWYRIVLDEAHTIKEANTLQARAASLLAARSRFCLTGTPIQNSIEDLFSLIRFLHLQPFESRAIWSKYCGNFRRPALMSNDKLDDELLDAAALVRLQTVMKYLTIRRTKDARRSNGELILELPRKFEERVYLQFDPYERATYNEMRQRYRDELEQLRVENHKYMYASMLHELSNLRMTCNHRELVESSKDIRRIQEAQADGILDDPQQAIVREGLAGDRAARYFATLCEADQATCMLCSYDLGEPLEADSGPSCVRSRPVLLQCTHLFCSDCLQDCVHRLSAEDVFKVKDEDSRFECPACGRSTSPLTEMRVVICDDVVQRSGANIVLTQETFGVDVGIPIADRAEYSTKIRALIADLEPFSRCNRKSRLFDPKAPHYEQVEAGDRTVIVVEASVP